MASQHHRKRESGKPPNKDDESPPRKKTTNLTTSPNKQDNELCVSCHSPVITDEVKCQWCKKWEHKVCAKGCSSQYCVLLFNMLCKSAYSITILF